MSRFDNRLWAVTAQVTCVDGLRGGIDTRCRVTVCFDATRQRPIVVEDTDVDAAVAIERAVDRAARSVARALRAQTEQMDWSSRKDGAVTRP